MSQSFTCLIRLGRSQCPARAHSHFLALCATPTAGTGRRMNSRLMARARAARAGRPPSRTKTAVIAAGGIEHQWRMHRPARARRQPSRSAV